MSVFTLDRTANGFIFHIVGRISPRTPWFIIGRSTSMPRSILCLLVLATALISSLFWPTGSIAHYTEACTPVCGWPQGALERVAPRSTPQRGELIFLAQSKDQARCFAQCKAQCKQSNKRLRWDDPHCDNYCHTVCSGSNR